MQDAKPLTGEALAEYNAEIKAYSQERQELHNEQEAALQNDAFGLAMLMLFVLGLAVILKTDAKNEKQRAAVRREQERKDREERKAREAEAERKAQAERREKARMDYEAELQAKAARKQERREMKKRRNALARQALKDHRKRQLQSTPNNPNYGDNLYAISRDEVRRETAEIRRRIKAGDFDENTRLTLSGHRIMDIRNAMAERWAKFVQDKRNAGYEGHMPHTIEEALNTIGPDGKAAFHIDHRTPLRHWAEKAIHNGGADYAALHANAPHNLRIIDAETNTAKGAN